MSKPSVEERVYRCRTFAEQTDDPRRPTQRTEEQGYSSVLPNMRDSLNAYSLMISSRGLGGS